MEYVHTGTANWIFLSPGLVGANHYSEAAAIRQYAGSYTAPYNTDLAENTWAIVRLVFNGASSTIQVNASAATTSDAGTNNIATAFVLGGTNYGAGMCHLHIKEFIVLSGTISADDLALIYAHLDATY
jgi:hypothetical protein